MVQYAERTKKAETMSAIFGILGKTADLDGLERMRRVLSGYGRQASETVAHGGLAMGCNLRWDNENCKREKPVQRSADGRYVLVADARVYNRDALVVELSLGGGDAANNDLLMAAYLK
jgi:asparagine synthetase B (glutamine-hydrolysing)